MQNEVGISDTRGGRRGCPRGALAMAFCLVPISLEPGLGDSEVPVLQGCSLPAAGLGDISVPLAGVQTRGAKKTSCPCEDGCWLCRSRRPRVRRMDVRGAACSLPAAAAVCWDIY